MAFDFASSASLAAGALGNFYVQFAIRTIIIIALFLIIKVASRVYIARLQKKAKSKEMQTRFTFLNKLISAVLVVLAVLLILAGIPQFKSFSYSLLASAGIIAVIVGFATQKTLSNVISGIFLALYEPFRVGDKVKLFDEYGEIEDLTLRHTVMKTWDNKRLIIPNSKIDDQEIVNYSIKDEHVLWTVNIGISYDSDINKARKIMLEQAKKHPANIEKQDPESYKTRVRVTECGDFSVNMRLYYWCEDAWAAWRMGFDLTETIKKEFDRKGVEIPFPYRTIVYKKDLEAKKKKKK